MGATVLTALVFGIEVKRSMFMVETGKTMRVCKNGHERETEAPFCDQCGTQVSAKPIERPTEAVEAWAKAHRRSPAMVWERLYEAREDDAAENGEKVAIFEVTPLLPYWNGNPSYALGLCLAKLRAWEPGRGPRVIDPAILTEKSKVVREFAVGFGIDGSVQLFLSLYCG